MILFCGEFTWLVSSNNKIRIGSKAGTFDKEGYVVIKINSKAYRRSRLVWFYVHGRWPYDQIDHINNHKTDDRISNLREATNTENSRNRKSFKTRKHKLPKWVYSHNNRFRARVKHGKKSIHLGMFDDPKEAHEVAYNYNKLFHGEFLKGDLNGF